MQTPIPAIGIWKNGLETILLTMGKKYLMRVFYLKTIKDGMIKLTALLTSLMKFSCDIVYGGLICAYTTVKFNVFKLSLRLLTKLVIGLMI
jgi:hypothetical protein